MTNWQLGDYVRINYTGGTKGWGRLEYRVTEDDVPLANGAEPGDFLWRPMGAHHDSIHETPMKLGELGAREVQDRRLWINFPYQKARMVVLDDLQYVALHGALKLHERIVRSFDQAALDLVKASERAEQAHKERQAKKEATKRLGGRDATRDRRKTKEETEAAAALKMAIEMVAQARYEACGIIACQLPDDTVGACFWDRSPVWDALERHPAWRSQYTLATDPRSSSSMGPLRTNRHKKREADIIERLEQERNSGLKEALRPPPPPVETCDCCGQQTNGPVGPFGRRRRTA